MQSILELLQPPKEEEESTRKSGTAKRKAALRNLDKEIVKKIPTVNNILRRDRLDYANLFVGVLDLLSDLANRQPTGRLRISCQCDLIALDDKALEMWDLAWQTKRETRLDYASKLFDWFMAPASKTK